MPERRPHVTDATVELGPDYRRLWWAHTTSASGSALASGALPLVAILVLNVSDAKVSLLAAISMVASAAVALPLGPWIEARRKRPVMVAADLLRALAIISVPVAVWGGWLTFTQLCVVASLSLSGQIAFSAASGAHLKALVAPPGRALANGRFEQATWATMSAGPPLGGLLISWLGPAVTLVIDAASYVLSALGVRAIRAPEPSPSRPDAADDVGSGRRRALVAGWSYIWNEPVLRRLFVNSLLFGGAIMMTSPLMALLMLREFGYSAWMYGLVLGLPCLGGLLGARLMPRLVRTHGIDTVLWWSGLLRVPWLALIAFVPAGWVGLVLILALDTLLLLVAGVFNPAFATIRLEATADSHLARTLTAWSIATKVVQPACVALGAALVAATSIRTAIFVGGLLCLVSALWVPRPQDTARTIHSTDEVDAVHG